MMPAASFFWLGKLLETTVPQAAVSPSEPEPFLLIGLVKNAMLLHVVPS
jgi:hypothetical protein